MFLEILTRLSNCERDDKDLKLSDITFATEYSRIKDKEDKLRFLESSDNKFDEMKPFEDLQENTQQLKLDEIQSRRNTQIETRLEIINAMKEPETSSSDEC